MAEQINEGASGFADPERVVSNASVGNGRGGINEGAPGEAAPQWQEQSREPVELYAGALFVGGIVVARLLKLVRR